MNILFVTSEVAPYAKTGGLADVSAALPRYLHRAGHDVRVFLPFYGRIQAKPLDKVGADFDITVGARSYRVAILRLARDHDAPLYLVDCPALYHRSSLYTNDPDEHIRFVVLSRAALEAAQRMAFAPDVIHGNDWQSGLLPLLLKVRYAWDRLFCAQTKTLLTIHNLNYSGHVRGRHLGRYRHGRRRGPRFIKTSSRAASSTTCCTAFCTPTASPP